MTSHGKGSIRWAVGSGLLAWMSFIGAAQGQTPTPVPIPTYHAGGTQPFPAELQAKLDEHADILTLGINIDWMRANNIDEADYVEAIWRIGNAVKEERIPGALIYVDRLVATTMPTGIGYMITDPEKHQVNADTLYYVEDLTGAMITMPLALSAAGEGGKIQLGEPIGKYLPSISHTELGKVTIEQLVRHQSGLPEQIAYEESFRTRWDMLEYLGSIKLAHRPGTKEEKSPYNFLLLGMMLEKVYDEHFSEYAEKAVLEYFAMSNSYMKPFPDKRQFVAPGEYGEWLGRLAWAEPAEPFGWVLHPDAGHTGLVTSADDMGHLVRGLLALAALQVPGQQDAPPMTRALTEPAKEGNTIGLGFQRGRFGPDSFGWDALGGTSIWILPEKQGFLMYFSNPAHPRGLHGQEDAIRDEVLPLLARSLGWGKETSGGVDTRNENSQPEQPSNSGNQ